ncbi:MAG: ribonuclease Z [Flavobacterium sp.]|nr:MAG: ribonuclease Z [Flavobacterium sp.]
MNVEEKGNTTIIKDTQGDAAAFLLKLTHEHKTFEKRNLIVDISDSASDIKTISRFKALSKTHRAAKKSFVIVASNIDFTDVPDSLVVVPTVPEAHDVIEMEEIERDLGF